MDEVQEQFDDPALKGAIRQAAGRPLAPSRLRDKVAAMMATTVPPIVAPVADTHRARGGWRLPRLTPQMLTAACVAIIASGFALYQINETFGPFFVSAPPPPAPVQFEQSFASSLVRAHHACAKLADHHLVAGNDPAAVKEQLAKNPATQAMRVFGAASLGEGWQFKGAGLCKVGDATAVHMLYTRGADQASVFSIVQDAMCASPIQYEHRVENDVIVGIARDHALYAVVESCQGASCKLEETRKLMSLVYSDIFGESCAMPAASH